MGERERLRTIPMEGANRQVEDRVDSREANNHGVDLGWVNFGFNLKENNVFVDWGLYFNGERSKSEE